MMDFDKKPYFQRMKIGYARVSTTEQSLELQKQALKKAGCKKIYEDILSGSKSDRPGLSLALEVLRPDDMLVVWKLDRLGRSVKQLVDFIIKIESQGVHFISLTDNINTGTTSGKFFFHVMASLAEMERDLIVERTKAGLQAAQQNGVKVGRKRSMTDSKLATAKKLIDGGTPVKEVAKSLGVSLPTIYRWV